MAKGRTFKQAQRQYNAPPSQMVVCRPRIGNGTGYRIPMSITEVHQGVAITATTTSGGGRASKLFCIPTGNSNTGTLTGTKASSAATARGQGNSKLLALLQLKHEYDRGGQSCTCMWVLARAFAGALCVEIVSIIQAVCHLLVVRLAPSRTGIPCKKVRG